MPKRKTAATKRNDDDDNDDVLYDDDDVNNFKPRKERSGKPRGLKSKKENDEDEVGADKSEVSNTTEIGKLYTNAFEVPNTIGPVEYFYMGTCKYGVSTCYNPLSTFNNYFNFVVNDICGYITNSNMDVLQLKYNPEKPLAHAFMSILYYNNVIVPTKIKIQIHESNMILGECMYYNKSYEKNELSLHICNNLVTRLLISTENFDITFSERINREQFSMKDNFKSYNDELHLTEELTNIIITLFTIADHAATHYIEDYTHSQTDWIHHFGFGKNLSSYILINTLFNVAANIHSLDATPKVVVDTKPVGSGDGLSLIEKIMNNSTLGMVPIEPINMIGI